MVKGDFVLELLESDPCEICSLANPRQWCEACNGCEACCICEDPEFEEWSC